MFPESKWNGNPVSRYRGVLADGRWLWACRHACFRLLLKGSEQTESAAPYGIVLYEAQPLSVTLREVGRVTPHQTQSLLLLERPSPCCDYTSLRAAWG